MNEDNKIVLLNEEGKEEEFFIVDIITIDEKEYVIANPADDVEYHVVFRIDKDESTEVLTLVDDEEELEEVNDAYFEENDFDEEDVNDSKQG